MRKDKEMKSDVKVSESMFRQIFDNMRQAFALHEIITDAGGKTIGFRLLGTNKTFEEVTGLNKSAVIDKTLDEIRISADRKDFVDFYERLLLKEEMVNKRIHYEPSGKYFNISLFFPLEGQIALLADDITDLVKREEEEKLMEKQIQHRQKMESVGELAAGIAHEINNPIQYVGDNLSFLKDSFADMMNLCRTAVKLHQSDRDGNDIRYDLARIGELTEAVDMEFLMEEVPQAIEQSTDGVKKVTKIVAAMRTFSHSGVAEDQTDIDINDAIDSTLTISRGRYKYVAEVQKDFGDIPLVAGYASDLNQAFLNLIVNAADAIREKGETKTGIITIRTANDQDHVVIEISDTGTGIPEEVQPKIFDPFFTTKGIGAGTGQGLSISYNMIVKKHNGSLTFKTERGRGSTFIIRLPI